jgi:hypothetical protein
VIYAPYLASQLTKLMVARNTANIHFHMPDQDAKQGQQQHQHLEQHHEQHQGQQQGSLQAMIDSLMPSSNSRSNGNPLQLEQVRNFLSVGTEGVTMQDPRMQEELLRNISALGLLAGGDRASFYSHPLALPQQASMQLSPFFAQQQQATTSTLPPTALQLLLMQVQGQQQLVTHDQHQRLNAIAVAAAAPLQVPPFANRSAGSRSPPYLQPATNALPMPEVTHSFSVQQPRPAAASEVPAAAPTVKPKKPKHPKTAYNYFFKDNRARIITSEGRVDFATMGQRIGALWKAVDNETKSKYEALAVDDKRRYYREKEIYIEAARDAQSEVQRQLESTVDEETRKRYLESSGVKSTTSKKKSKKQRTQRRAESSDDSE